MWCLEASTVVVFRGCSRFISFRAKKVSAAAINPRSGAIRLRTAREINPSHSKSISLHSRSYQPSTQQAVQLSLDTARAITPRPASATSPRQASATSLRTAGVTSLRPASTSSFLLQETHSANSVVVQQPPALKQPLAKSEGGRRFSMTPPFHSPFRHGPRISRGCVDTRHGSLLSYLYLTTLGRRGGCD